MDPARWQQIERLYHAALARPATERAAFLVEACRDDDALREEVEALLDTPPTADGVFASPAVGMPAPIADDRDRWNLTGRRLGVYHLQELIGIGGMGEVYRARDARLGRGVAIKILPRAFASEPDRLARFEREARVLAALSHPNIATIHGIEEVDGIRGLVMELVEGETLAERLEQGTRHRSQGTSHKCLPIDEALSIAHQIAEALEAAHEKGIVHRDLKPANIKITPSGIVKVLDFGLAKVATGESEASQAPTVTIDGTREGMIVGTAAYMSPEQARGQAVDKRTDIWAFGCVLYEMLTGRAAFAGETISDTIAAILERQPDWTALPPGISPGVNRVLRRCLEKDPRNRLRDIGDARIEIDDRDVAQSVVGGTPPGRRFRSWSLAAVAVAVAVASTAGLALSLLRSGSPVTEPVALQFTIAPRPQERLNGMPVPSPAGDKILLVVVDASGDTALWLRSLASPELRRLAGTDGADQNPFWSQDGRYVGFAADGRLKKLDVAGGATQIICTCVVGNMQGATWNADGVIVFSPSNRAPLHRVAAAGGTPRPVTSLDVSRNENSHRWPHFLPDGRRFLYTARSDVSGNTGVYLGSIDSEDRQWLFQAQSNATYVPHGYILFARDGTLMALRFDTDRLAVSGEPAVVAANVAYNPAGAVAFFSPSADGEVLAYRHEIDQLSQLVWFDRAGARLGAVGPPGLFGPAQQFRMAPDGNRAAVVRQDTEDGNRDIWLVDLGNGGLSRLTAHPATDWFPVWSPDGTHVIFASDRNGASAVFRTAADGTGTEELVLGSGGPSHGRFPNDWSADGRFLTVSEDTLETQGDLMVFPLSGEGSEKTLRPLGQTRFLEAGGMVSPDGRWVAYVSNETGPLEVYVMPIGGGTKYPVSTAGGRLPIWSRDGRELFFLSADNRLMVAEVRADDAFAASVPAALFETCLGATAPAYYQWSYGITRDGQRSLWLCPAGQESGVVTVALRWTASLTDRVR